MLENLRNRFSFLSEKQRKKGDLPFSIHEEVRDRIARAGTFEDYILAYLQGRYINLGLITTKEDLEIKDANLKATSSGYAAAARKLASVIQRNQQTTNGGTNDLQVTMLVKQSKEKDIVQNNFPPYGVLAKYPRGIKVPHEASLAFDTTRDVSTDQDYIFYAPHTSCSQDACDTLIGKYKARPFTVPNWDLITLLDDNLFVEDGDDTSSFALNYYGNNRRNPEAFIAAGMLGGISNEPDLVRFSGTMMWC